MKLYILHYSNMRGRSQIINIVVKMIGHISVIQKHEVFILDEYYVIFVNIG